MKRGIEDVVDSELPAAKKQKREPQAEFLLAILSGQIEGVRRFISLGKVDLNLSYQGKTPLKCAILSTHPNRISIIRLLAEAGADTGIGTKGRWAKE